MARRIMITLVSALALISASILIRPAWTMPAPTPNQACVLGCQNSTIRVSPHGGSVGSFSKGAIVAVEWQVTNLGDTVADLAVTAGATGCGQRVPPYSSPREVILDPDGSVTVHTYVTGFCVGAGTVYAGAGQDQGFQAINFF